MYAAHLAAGLAIKSRAPKASTWALLVGVFVPDFFWIGLAAIGLEPTDPKIYFDDWSHSLVSIVVEATFFALVFYRRGIEVWLPVWLAVFSHFLLDFPIHPRPLALYPHSSTRLGWDLWQWGLSRSPWGPTNYWLVQLAVVGVLLAVYASGAQRAGIAANLTAASCIAVLGLHLIF